LLLVASHGYGGLMNADESTSPGADGEEAAVGQRRFRAELQKIPTVSHPVYGSCLAPEYPSQLLIALGHLGSLPIGAWRGQASIEWGLDPSLSVATAGTRGAGRAPR
jgi:hypothetical protein